MERATIEAGVRTVVHLFGYVDELKQQAMVLRRQTPGQVRGYFTPAEDDNIRALLVSYRQSRAALLELIASFRADDSLSDEDRPAAFLVAFAAALILVDAARFLRELVTQQPLLRSKLNEPAPGFGIPGGTYDTVQASLVSARHAWHLYHALSYAEANDSLLRRVAAERSMTTVVDIVDQLRDRLDISLAQYASARWRTQADQTMRRMGRGVYRYAIYGMQKLGASLAADIFVRRGHRPALPPDIDASMRLLLRPGDVLVVRKEYAVTNYFLPGYWPHAALYLGGAEDLADMGLADHKEVRPRWAKLLGETGDDGRRALESMKDGVNIRAIESPLASDSVVVLRPRLSSDELAEGLGRALAHEGKPYDFDFDFSRSDRLVCTEVVYRAYDGIGPMKFRLTRRAGRPTFSGADLLQMALSQKGFEPAAVFAPRLAEGLIVRPEDVEEILRIAQGKEMKE